jgi:rSAM/selenodomain-associated transferase 2
VSGADPTPAGGIAAPGAGTPAAVSVVIPTCNEERNLGRCLDALLRGGAPGEVIVCDGGSTDGTRAVAAGRPGVRWLASERGRGRQMNAGARAARGRLLWFLHADSVAPPGAARAVAEKLAHPGIALGAFRFALDAAGPGYRLIELGVRLRSERLGLPYGDQGLFCRRALFEAVGGYPDVRIMEDVAFVRAARARGRLEVLPLPLVTSSRRWRRHGVLRTTIRNYALILAELAGAPEAALLRMDAVIMGRGAKR